MTCITKMLNRSDHSKQNTREGRKSIRKVTIKFCLVFQNRESLIIEGIFI